MPSPDSKQTVNNPDVYLDGSEDRKIRKLTPLSERPVLSRSTPIHYHPTFRMQSLQTKKGTTKRPVRWTTQREPSPHYWLAKIKQSKVDKSKLWQIIQKYSKTEPLLIWPIPPASLDILRVTVTSPDFPCLKPSFFLFNASKHLHLELPDLAPLPPDPAEDENTKFVPVADQIHHLEVPDLAGHLLDPAQDGDTFASVLADPTSPEVAESQQLGINSQLEDDESELEELEPKEQVQTEESGEAEEGTQDDEELEVKEPPQDLANEFEESQSSDHDTMELVVSDHRKNSYPSLHSTRITLAGCESTTQGVVARLGLESAACTIIIPHGPKMETLRFSAESACQKLLPPDLSEMIHIFDNDGIPQVPRDLWNLVVSHDPVLQKMLAQFKPELNPETNEEWISHSKLGMDIQDRFVPPLNALTRALPQLSSTRKESLEFLGRSPGWFSGAKKLVQYHEKLGLVLPFASVPVLHHRDFQNKMKKEALALDTIS
ncbi:hypothetical protein C8J56DRAFT_1090671 [Mycena floridula]|nr:hypothetical protein C8J56DRAFT_1090671 [Mycena floridula]